jgi:hypothetical protein
MSAADALWFIGECGAAWLFGVGVGFQWAKVKQAFIAAVE